MKQYTTPVLRMRMEGCGQLLARADLIEATFRRGSAECRVVCEVDGEDVLAPLGESQTGILCNGPKGHICAEVTVVADGVAKSKTFYIEAQPAVRSEAIGRSGALSGSDGEVLDVALMGELVIAGDGASADIPTATDKRLGIVMVGSGLSVDGNGLLSAEVDAAGFADLSNRLGSLEDSSNGYAAQAKQAMEEAVASSAAAGDAAAAAQDSAESASTAFATAEGYAEQASLRAASALESANGASASYEQAQSSARSAVTSMQSANESALLAGNHLEAARASAEAAAAAQADALASAEQAAEAADGLQGAIESANQAAQAANDAAQAVADAIGGSY